MFARILLALALATSAATAAPRARRPGVVATFLAARTECAKPGARLSSLVERVFDPEGFGGRIIARWHERTDDERAAFAELADRVVGTEDRARAVAALCVPHARVVGASGHAGSSWFVKVHRADIDDCTSLMFSDDGERWRFDGVWFCGKSLYLDNWKHKLGGEREVNRGVDYDTAMAKLRALAGD